MGSFITKLRSYFVGAAVLLVVVLFCPKFALYSAIQVMLHLKKAADKFHATTQVLSKKTAD
jgi:hypothetical protein